VPKLAKRTKVDRDQGVIQGLRAQLTQGEPLVINGVTYTVDELAAFFEEHLVAMARVQELTIARSVAVAQERALEARLAPIYVGVKGLAASMYGKTSPGMQVFGIKPDKKPTMTVQTKQRANEKRQQTRKALGIMGKKQRARLKRGG
jgi:hypothetical protein